MSPITKAMAIIVTAVGSAGGSGAAKEPGVSHDGRFNTPCPGSPASQSCQVGFVQLIAHCERYQKKIVAVTAMPARVDDTTFLWNSPMDFSTLRVEEAVVIDSKSMRAPKKDVEMLDSISRAARSSKIARFARIRGRFHCESRGSGVSVATLGYLSNVTEVTEVVHLAPQFAVSEEDR